MPRSTSAPPVRAAQPGSCAELQLEVTGQDLQASFDTRRYRVRGLERNWSLAQLRVNLLACRDELVHLDTLDLYQARSRAAFIKAAASELYVDEAVIKRDVGRLLLALEQIVQQRIEEAARPQAKPVELSEAEQQAALKLLRDRHLVERIQRDYDACGLVGEAENKLLCYLACVSRLLPRPLAVLVQSGSAAGKTSLVDATLRLMPPEAQLRYSAMTGQSLYYMGGGDLRHKILAVAEEQGVREAGYALKLLQSDGRLRIAAAGKNRGSGRQQTETYEVQGPVAMLLTTTASQPDDELENRCLVLHVSETAEQTAAIQTSQREAYTLEGQRLRSREEQVRALHHNAQRMLAALPVVIPAADRLRFRHDQTRMRREHARYLSLIAASALLHQYQRPRRTVERDGNGDGEPREFIEATLDDVLLAGRLLSAAAGRRLDQLLPQTRQLLVLLDDHVAELARREEKPRDQVRFTQRGVREALGWGDFQLRRHLARLVELEYVLVYRTGRGNQRVYELLYDGQGRQGQPFVLGLVEAEQLLADPSAAGNDHLDQRNDHRPMGHRSPIDAPPSTGENSASRSPAKRLRDSAAPSGRRRSKRR